jgi:predicted DCC family thiol-disulfide oxidoreductase YuxK
VKSEAVILILSRLGGLWGLAGIALQAMPKPVRDLGYTAVGRIRHRLFRKPQTACPLVPAALGLRFDP